MEFALMPHSTQNEDSEGPIIDAVIKLQGLITEAHTRFTHYEMT